MKFKNVVPFIAIALALYGCSEKKATKGRPPTPVEVEKIIEKDTPVYIDAVGNIGAWNTIDIRSQVTGVLQESHIMIGQEVSIGQLIYTIDPAPYKAALEKANAQLREDQANLKLAEDKLLRYTSLAELDYISQLQYDEYVTNVELFQAKIDLDKAQIDEAKINLDYCYIRSPVNGKISYNTFDPGNLILAGSSQALTTVRQMDPVLVNFSIPQKDFLKLQREHDQGQTKFLYIMLDTDGKEVNKEGVIYFIDNNFDLNTGNILLRGEISNGDYTLWPGQFGKIQLIVKVIKNAILVPQEAVQVGQKGSYVYILKEDNTVEERTLDIAENVGKYLVITKGVSVGETVITSGQINLKPGAKVVVRDGNISQSSKNKTKDEKEKNPVKD